MEGRASKKFKAMVHFSDQRRSVYVHSAVEKKRVVIIDVFVGTCIDKLSGMGY